MKTTHWRKPITDVLHTGMDALIYSAYKKSHFDSSASVFSEEFIVHAYREIGTAVEASIEVRVKNPLTNKVMLIKFMNITI